LAGSRALARAHGLVRRNSTEGGLTGLAAGLDSLLRTVVQPHQPVPGGPERPARFSLEGPQVALGDHAINNIALIFHELVTNAAKYGALQAEEGSVGIAWSLDGRDLVLRWTECGGRPLDGPPASIGFGSLLVSRTVKESFGGSVSYDWKRDGLEVLLRLPLDALAR
jgi:two-component sensor histidine kinase